MSYEKQQRIFYYLLLLLLGLVYVSGLFIDVTRDAAKYAYISKEIIQTGNWINLQILGEPYDQKPHLMFWLASVSFRIFGVSNFSFKLPFLLYSALGLFFTFKLGETLFNKNTGKLAATITAFSLIFILYNQDIHTDILLFSNSAFALWQLFEYLKKSKIKNLLIAGLALGLCLLTKGPFGCLIPFLSVVGYLLSQRKWKALFNANWVLLIVVAFIIASPVFIQLYMNWGLVGISFFFFGNTIGRFTGSYLGHTPDPTFYIHNISYLLLPWTLLFFIAVFNKIKAAYNKQLNQSDHFLFWGLMSFLVLISVSKSKLPNYIMCALPLIAILSSDTWINVFRNSTRLLKTQSIVIYLMWLLSSISVIIFSNNGMIWKLAILMASFLLVLYLTKPFNYDKKILYQSLSALVIIGLTINLTVLPVLFGLQSQPKAATLINDLNMPNTKVFNYQKEQFKYTRRLNVDPNSQKNIQFNQTPDEKHFSYDYELMFYNKNTVNHVETNVELQNAMKTKNAWIFCDEEGKNAILNNQFQIDTIYTFNHFNLKRTAKYIFPDKNKSPFVNRYLIKTPN